MRPGGSQGGGSEHTQARQDEQGRGRDTAHLAARQRLRRFICRRRLRLRGSEFVAPPRPAAANAPAHGEPGRGGGLGRPPAAGNGGRGEGRPLFGGGASCCRAGHEDGRPPRERRRRRSCTERALLVVAAQGAPRLTCFCLTWFETVAAW